MKTKSIILATGLTAIALTGIGCSSSHSLEKSTSNRPVQAGHNCKADERYTQRKKAEKKDTKEQYPRPYDTATSKSRMAYSSK